MLSLSAQTTNQIQEALEPYLENKLLFKPRYVSGKYHKTLNFLNGGRLMGQVQCVWISFCSVLLLCHPAITTDLYTALLTSSNGNLFNLVLV